MGLLVVKMLATIFDIQRFSIHDGPGIRTTIFFKGCPLRCAWCQNPESHNPDAEIAFYSERCARCFKCKEACPDNLILDLEDKRIDHRRCNACGRCSSVCMGKALRKVGSKWDAVSLFAVVVKDKDYFADSNGGITLSGGEPAIHTGFLREFLPLAKKEGIHVTMETCGMFKWDEVKAILSFLDLIYFDLKYIDPEMHRNFTGVGNGVILENFGEFLEASSELVARMPVIPTINDTPKNVIDTARFLTQHNKKSIQLLPYHSLGEAKLGRIETELKPLNLPHSANYISAAREMFEREGIHAIAYE